MSEPKSRKEQCIDEINWKADAFVCCIAEDYKELDLDMIYSEMILAITDWYQIIKHEREDHDE